MKPLLLSTLFLFTFGCAHDTSPERADSKPQSRPMQAACSGQSALTITNLKDGQGVTAEMNIEGSVPNPQSRVWVFIHPLHEQSRTQFWPQEEARVSSNCTWFVGAHFAQPGDQFRGQRFEVRAIENPRPIPKAGQPETNWPQGDNYSSLVTVVRE